MTEERTSGYAYPPDLARLVRERWTEMPVQTAGIGVLPDQEILDEFIAACYQASMLREEERSVTFRAILAAPALFSDEGRPPASLQRLEFGRALSFDPAELRRLSVAADTQRTLIGVDLDEQGRLRIWGLVHSGRRWLRDVLGGRRAGAPLPPAPVILVDGPGNIAAHKGYDLIAKLRGGRLSGSRSDPFHSKWLPKQFAPFKEKLMTQHELAAGIARERRGERWASLEPSLPRRISERMLKRAISILREGRHGGTIIFIPVEQVGSLSGADPPIDIKYRFAAGPPQHAFPDLVVDLLNRLALVYGVIDPRRLTPVSWREFEGATDDELATLDEALFETANLTAGLAAADGAVVLSKQHDLLGFGGMISGRLPPVRNIARALDIEGEIVAEEPTGNVGARHRSAYRLASALPGALAIVISQDGGVRFVSQKDGRLTYWEQE